MKAIKSLVTLAAATTLLLAVVCEPGGPVATTATTSPTPSPLPAELVQIPEGECITSPLADGREIAVCGWAVQQGVRWYSGEISGEGPVRVSEHWLCDNAADWPPRSPGIVYSGLAAQAMTGLGLLGALVIVYGAIKGTRTIRALRRE